MARENLIKLKKNKLKAFIFTICYTNARRLLELGTLVRWKGNTFTSNIEILKYNKQKGLKINVVKVINHSPSVLFVRSLVRLSISTIPQQDARSGCVL